MAVKLYNFLTRTKELFVPLKNNEVGFYACGPTVYDGVHLGNLRTYIFEDILKKNLEYNGYEVRHIMNITDVEDKIIKKMRDENKTLKEITEPYTKLFFEDLKKLNIKKADKFPKATNHIKEMVKLISVLLEKKIAYQSENDSVYFDTSKFKKYGDFSRIDKENLKHGARVEADEYNKKNAGDFILWKRANDEPSWNAPRLGRGRPGWHIECSAMSMKYLGETFDIHAGAIDLLFPHHENEIAQSEAVTDKQFVKFWVEGEHLLVDNQKMSKSLKNFYTLEDIEKRNFNPLAFRFLALNTHYRNKLNFTWAGLEAAQSGLNHLKERVRELGKTKRKINLKFKKEFTEKINDDLNIPQALAVLQKLLKSNLNSEDKLATALDFDKVLGLKLAETKKEEIKIPKKVQKLAEEREKARQKKDWRKADELREKINKLSYEIKDLTKDNYVIIARTK
ncbi:cysteine--tRNA ligase [Patescibacteria group bacterium]|nr:cysteine--tRNA ligase [Patescibacteria group bacterium]